MTISQPSYLSGVQHTASSDRTLVSSLLGSPYATFSGTTTPTVGGSHGVVTELAFRVTEAVPAAMTVSVAAGAAFVRGSSAGSMGQGSYHVVNDAQVVLPIAAANATQTRHDLIVLRVRDAEQGNAGNDAVLQVVQGTPSPAPLDPTVPSDCLVLARITVSANLAAVTSVQVQDLRTFASALGGIQPVRSATKPSGAREGQMVYERDNDQFAFWNGSAWTSPGGIVPCLSTARPLPAYDGARIWETDTGMLLVAYQGQWCIAPGSSIVNYQRQTLTLTGTTGASHPFPASDTATYSSWTATTGTPTVSFTMPRLLPGTRVFYRCNVIVLRLTSAGSITQNTIAGVRVQARSDASTPMVGIHNTLVSTISGGNHTGRYYYMNGGVEVNLTNANALPGSNVTFGYIAGLATDAFGTYVGDAVDWLVGLNVDVTVK